MSAVAIQSLPAGLDDAARLAARLGLAAQPIDVHRFPDGELRVTVAPAAEVTVVYAALDQPNDKLVALVLAADALRAGGAHRLVLVAPYLCYMRQDMAFHPGEAVSQKAVGRLLAGLFDRVITVDAQLHRTRAIAEVFPGIAADNLSAIPAIADAVAATGFDRDTVIVGPDAESQPWVADLAGRLGVISAVARKIRRGDRSVAIGLPDPGVVAGRPVLLVDDIVSSGGTLIACADHVLTSGAASVDAIIVHALFAPDLISAFKQAGIRSIRSTTSVPHPTNAIALDAVLAAALHGEFGAAQSRRAP